jgi:hypothetical protein
MGTSGVRGPPHLTSAEASADRVALTPVSAAAFTGRAPRLATFGRASAVKARRPLLRGVVPAETSGSTCEFRVDRT